MLKFAILKYVKGRDGNTVVLEYDLQQIEDRLIKRTIEGLDKKQISSLVGLRKTMKSTWSESEITNAVRGAFLSIVSELKEQTVGVV